MSCSGGRSLWKSYFRTFCQLRFFRSQRGVHRPYYREGSIHLSRSSPDSTLIDGADVADAAAGTVKTTFGRPSINRPIIIGANIGHRHASTAGVADKMLNERRRTDDSASFSDQQQQQELELGQLQQWRRPHVTSSECWHRCYKLQDRSELHSFYPTSIEHCESNPTLTYI